MRECVTVLRPAHTINVDTFAVVVQLICTKSDSNPSPPFHVVGATRFGHQLLTAMVDVRATVCALDALPHETIEQAATVVAPGWAKIVGCLKLVWDWFLKNVKCLSVSEDIGFHHICSYGPKFRMQMFTSCSGTFKDV